MNKTTFGTHSGARDTRDTQIADVLKTEFSENFVAGMKNRMVVSFYKYGPLREAYPDNVNALESLALRLQKYRDTKNLEYLIDVANFAMIEFLCPSIKGAYFKETDSNASPGRVWQPNEFDGESETSQRANDGTPQHETQHLHSRVGRRVRSSTDPGSSVPPTPAA